MKKEIWTENKEEGEISAIMGDIKRDTQSMMDDIREVNDFLNDLEKLLQTEKVDKEQVMETIKAIKLRIGVLEKEDQRELSEEEIADSLISKLKKWMDAFI